MWKVTAQNAPTVLVLSASVVSCALGAQTAHILTKRYMTAKYETLITEEVQQAKAYFSMRDKTGAYADPVKLAEKVVYEEYEEKVSPYSGAAAPARPTVDPGSKVSKIQPHEDMESFEQRLINEAKSEVEETKQRLGVFDDEDEDDEQEEVVVTNVFASQSASSLDKSGRKSNQPYIIDHDEFYNGDEDYNQNSLTYFEGDKVLVDERDQPINHLNRIIGDNNLKFGTGSQDPNIVYIRNNELEVDFEVSRSNGKFSEEVLGFELEHSDKRRPRKFREFD